jgi:hypothetical protein
LEQRFETCDLDALAIANSGDFDDPLLERAQPGRFDVDGDELAEEVVTVQMIGLGPRNRPATVGAENEAAIRIEDLPQERLPQRRTAGAEDVGDESVLFDSAALRADELEGALGEERVAAIARVLVAGGRERGVELRIDLRAGAAHGRLLGPDASRDARAKGR